MTKLTGQEVKVYGEHAGYQFNRNSAGKRTVKTTVVVEDGNIYTGTVIWKGRKLEVTRVFPWADGKYLKSIWKTVREL